MARRASSRVSVMLMTRLFWLQSMSLNVAEEPAVAQ
jgi:hypothetical protein